MKRIALVGALLLGFAAAPAVAQTRVSVALGFGTPRPYVSGVVVVGRPYVVYDPYVVYPRPVVVEVVRPYRYYYYHYHPAVVVVERGHGHRRHHHDDDEDEDDE